MLSIHFFSWPRPEERSGPSGPSPPSLFIPSSIRWFRVSNWGGLVDSQSQPFSAGNDVPQPIGAFFCACFLLAVASKEALTFAVLYFRAQLFASFLFASFYSSLSIHSSMASTNSSSQTGPKTSIRNPLFFLFFNQYLLRWSEKCCHSDDIVSLVVRDTHFGVREVRLNQKVHPFHGSEWLPYFAVHFWNSSQRCIRH